MPKDPRTSIQARGSQFDQDHLPSEVTPEKENAYEIHLFVVQYINMIIELRAHRRSSGSAPPYETVQQTMRMHAEWRLSEQNYAVFGAFQNCINRLTRFPTLAFSFFSPSTIIEARDSIDSLLRSP
jgi:hypothetical protein